jgi:indole-3-glycerol phosphate synthase
MHDLILPLKKLCGTTRERWRSRRKIAFAIVKRSIAAAPAACSFTYALHQSTLSPALIAEVKNASPSKGVIQSDYQPVATPEAKERGETACCCVLTDSKYLRGSHDYMLATRAAGVTCPLL